MIAADIVVVGSLNMDLVARAPRLPVPGETVPGRTFQTASGGKGANQAVAAARLGGRTAMIGCVGDDAFGVHLRSGLEADGVDCTRVQTIRGVSSGVALIVVDDAGQNGIVVVSGANGRLIPADVDTCEAALAAARVVVLQLETPLETVEYAAQRARALDKVVVLNPAPARPLPASLLACADFLVPNEIEAAALSGVRVDSVDAAIEAGRRLRGSGAGTVLVTLGAQGVVMVGSGGASHHPATPVDAVDTTAAGDTFIGGLSAALVHGRTLSSAIAFAQAAAAICVTRPGAQPSIPFLREVAVPGEEAP